MSITDKAQVPPKTKGRKRQRETEKPLSGLDVDALLKQEPKRSKISAENAIPEFKQILSLADTIETIHDAVKQMETIVEEQIKHSLGDANYDRVIEGLGTMREELLDYEEPAVYNDLIRQLKKKILDESLGGDRRELWWLIRKGKLGLIDNKASEISTVPEEEAAEVSHEIENSCLWISLKIVNSSFQRPETPFMRLVLLLVVSAKLTWLTASIEGVKKSQAISNSLCYRRK